MKLIQCCVDPQNTMQNECCESCPSFEMWQNEYSGSEPRGLTIGYLGNDCSDGFFYTKTVFLGETIGPDCSDFRHAFDNCPILVDGSPDYYNTDYTSWSWNLQYSARVQVLVDKAKNDGLIGSSTTIELYADSSLHTVLYDPELMDEYGEVVGGTRQIMNGDLVRLIIDVTYRVAPCVIIGRSYLAELIYQGNYCPQTHIANVTWYDTEQPDGTYWSIEGVDVTISER